MKVFSTDHLNERQHRNIHESYDDLCQRLFNTIDPNSCIPPHRHASDPKDELLIAVVNPWHW